MLNSKNRLTICMKEPQELFIMTIHHLLREFLIKTNHFQLTKEIFKVYLSKFINSYTDYLQVFGIMCSKQIRQTHMHFEIDKNFIPEILRKLDMELKPYYIWHLKFGARSLKLSKWAHF